MLGAIIGDIVGSVYEGSNIKTKNFPLFHKRGSFTDDTVMTVAVADALMNGKAVICGDGIDPHESVFVSPDEFIDSMKKWGELYPHSGYGASFRDWLFSDNREPYNSRGNGSAMRVSPCGWIVPIQQFISMGVDATKELAAQSAEVTHNHPEGIKGAQAVAVSIYVAKHGRIRNAIDRHKDFIRKSIFGVYGYDLNRTLDEIRPTYRLNESCQGTVPEAIIAFLESTGFEDAIRNAISLGGDTDTLAAITGSIAEAAYGIPEDIKETALGYLDKPLREVVDRWYKTMSARNGLPQ